MNIADVKIGTVISVSPNHSKIGITQELRKTVIAGSSLSSTNGLQYGFYHSQQFHSLDSYMEVDGTLPGFTKIA